MNRPASRVDFNQTRQRFEAFVKATGAAGHPFSVEPVMRLEQLHWLCGAIGESEIRALELHHREPNPTEASGGLRAALVELQTLTEAFYYIAWRLVSLLDRNDGPLPTFSGLRKSCGRVRMVRNQLLEHPEGANSGVHVPSIMFGSGNGPQLKFISELKVNEEGRPMFRTNSEDLFDEGLWVNAAELKDSIERRLGASNGG